MPEHSEEFERPEPAPYDELSEDDVMALQAENERLRAEVRRFQRILIDAAEGTADCEDLCMVLCAGPCQGINLSAVSGSSGEVDRG